MSIRKQNRFKGGVGILLLIVLATVVLFGFARGLDAGTSGGSGGGGGSSAPANIKFTVDGVEYTIKNGSLWSEVVARYENFSVDDLGRVKYNDTYLVDDINGFPAESTHKVSANMAYVFCDHRHLNSGAVYTTVDARVHSSNGTCGVCGFTGDVLAKHVFDNAECRYCGHDCVHDCEADKDGTCSICHLPVNIVYVLDQRFLFPKDYTWERVVDHYADFTVSSDRVYYKGNFLVDGNGNIASKLSYPVNQACYNYCDHTYGGNIYPFEDHFTDEYHLATGTCKNCGPLEGEQQIPHTLVNGRCTGCNYMCKHSTLTGTSSAVCPDCGAKTIFVAVNDGMFHVTSGTTWAEMVANYDAFTNDSDGRVYYNSEFLVDNKDVVQTVSDIVTADGYWTCRHSYILSGSATYTSLNDIQHNKSGTCLNGCGIVTHLENHTYLAGSCMYCEHVCSHSAGLDDNDICKTCGELVECDGHVYDDTGKCTKCGAAALVATVTYNGNVYFTAGETWQDIIDRDSRFAWDPDKGVILVGTAYFIPDAKTTDQLIAGKTYIVNLV